jgi:hypothetical protein
MRHVGEVGTEVIKGNPVWVLYQTVMGCASTVRIPKTRWEWKPSAGFPVFSARCLGHSNLTGQSGKRARYAMLKKYKIRCQNRKCK